MVPEKRRFTRFEIPLILQFNLAREWSRYTSWGLTRDFSLEGFSFETEESNFDPEEALVFKLKFPQKGTSISLIGNVVWKMCIEDRCMAGIKLKEDDEKMKRILLEKICDYRNIPLDDLFSEKAPEGMPADTGIEESAETSVGDTLPVYRPSEQSDTPGIKKQYLESGAVCKVTFRLQHEAAPDADSIALVGDFNNWNQTETVMQRTEHGDFTVTMELPCNREYRFRYLINGTRWENDWHADKYLPNSFGCDDSVVVI